MILKYVSIFLDKMRPLCCPCLNAFKLEVPYFFDSWNSHLLDDSFQKYRTVFIMPLFCKLLIVDNLLSIKNIFGMLLKESEDDSGGPFFTVKIVKLKSILLLKFFQLRLAFFTKSRYGLEEDFHPIQTNHFAVLRQIIMDAFPEKLQT